MPIRELTLVQKPEHFQYKKNFNLYVHISLERQSVTSYIMYM